MEQMKQNKLSTQTAPPATPAQQPQRKLTQPVNQSKMEPNNPDFKIFVNASVDFNGDKYI